MWCSDTECYTNTSARKQAPFKFQSSADHCWHWNLSNTFSWFLIVCAVDSDKWQWRWKFSNTDTFLYVLVMLFGKCDAQLISIQYDLQVMIIFWGFTPCNVFGLFWNICLNQIQSRWSHSSKTLKQTILYDVETQEINIIWITAAVDTWKLQNIGLILWV
jgi:hypothetical protein